MTKPKGDSKLGRYQSKKEMGASLWEAENRWKLAAHRNQSADASRDGTTHPKTSASTGLYPVPSIRKSLLDEYLLT